MHHKRTPMQQPRSEDRADKQAPNLSLNPDASLAALWYHIVFLGSLVPLVVLGAKLLGSRGTSAAKPLAQPDRSPAALARRPLAAG